MFNNLANYLLGTIVNQQDEAAGVIEETNLRLTSVSEDDWILVDRDSEGNSEISSDEESDGREPSGSLSLQRTPTRTSSTSSLPCATMEESWFLTPPACFTSTGPIHVETSPLENLLIEHPSMSVYQHSQHHTPISINRRYVAAPIPLVQVDVEVENEQEDVEEEMEQLRRPEVILIAPRRNRLNILQRQERQCFKNKQAQKVSTALKCFRIERDPYPNSFFNTSRPQLRYTNYLT